MPHVVKVATVLDRDMLFRHGITVAPPSTPIANLPKCSDLADQLGGRYLLRYLRKPDVFKNSILSGVTHFSKLQYVTPTAICRQELVSALCLPPLPPPTHALLLDPLLLDAVGPRQIQSGQCIEYVLLNGFPVAAIVAPGWAVPID